MWWLGNWSDGEGEGTVGVWYDPFSVRVFAILLLCVPPVTSITCSAVLPLLLLLSVVPSVFSLRFIQSILCLYPSFSLRPCLFLVVLSGVPVGLPLFAVRVRVSRGNFSWFFVLVPFASCSLHVLQRCEIRRIGLVL